MFLEVETHRRDLVDYRETRHHLAPMGTSGSRGCVVLCLHWVVQAEHDHSDALDYNLIRHNILEHHTKAKGPGSSCLVVGPRDGIWRPTSATTPFHYTDSLVAKHDRLWLIDSPPPPLQHEYQGKADI